MMNQQRLIFDTAALNGGLLTKTLYLSVDPYMRGRMEPGRFMSWIPGHPWNGFGICEVLRSELPGFEKGDLLHGAIWVVGSVVCQLAKAMGLRVLGSTGSDQKAFNYKTASVEEEIENFGELDIYWDNVGGKMLDTAMAHMKEGGRIVVCGQISEYNIPDEEKYGIKHIWNMVYRELKMQGLYVFTFEQQYVEEFYATVPKMVADGKLKYTEDITVGLEHAGEVLLKLLHGQNIGKAIIQMQA
ncbi:NADP-binding protein [Dacryopinax primogenitus]|uniref:NADP-binding protein n=1 Tax=Dacryopinax primogenitus (strain DJM 731) TaxID=1858805 RepID=M5G0K6_DACPD|nr:NADP-binding protein [Dacryopinax primogenitus]EJU01660.1 NADP-binding protein [Dacryopinax primogenitus]